jgi:hypothetical protein
MATAIAAVTLNEATYTALASSATAVSLYLKRGQAVRLSVGSPGDADTTTYAILEGPSSNVDGAMGVHSFTLSGSDLYARLIRGSTSVIVIKT